MQTATMDGKTLAGLLIFSLEKSNFYKCLKYQTRPLIWTGYLFVVDSLLKKC